ncbi:MAG: HlyD family efflux transporter periplasmic adaptor subunit [Pirellulaceae bacterium]|nr:HlyD family efflux transporter periplasmic adaptor subunit [Pirellulaceae bacterium]
MSSSIETTRPLNLRFRTELKAVVQTYQGQNYWLLKDPLTLKYYRFAEEEYTLLQLLDGQKTVAEIQKQFYEKHAPKQLSLQELEHFLGSLHQSGLLISEQSGQGDVLYQRQQKNQQKKRLALFSNFLFLRLPGMNPTTILEKATHYFGWLFSLPAIAFGGFFALSALFLIFSQFNEFTERLPDFYTFFSAENWLLLGITLTITKIIHEFGHGIACKYYGSECHEMGVMFLVFMPCLYCDVSDSWTLPNKWQRITIGAGGIYFEILLAAGATFLWWFTQEGLLHFLALNVMVVCSTGTLLFNANPLMRFDGYYILSDYLEIPNLRDKANASLRQTAGKWCLGLPEKRDPFLPQKNRIIFALYSVACLVYRWILSLSILWMLYHIFKPYGLQIIGQLLVFLSLFTLLVLPATRFVSFLRTPGKQTMLQSRSILISLTLLTGIIIGILWIPLPYSVRCKFYLQPKNAVQVYPPVAGQLKDFHVTNGAVVDKEMPLVFLENRELERQIEELKGDLELAELEQQTANQLALLENNASLDLLRLKAKIDAITEQLEAYQQEKEGLTIRSPLAGTAYLPVRYTGHQQATTSTPNNNAPLLKKEKLGSYLRGDQLLLEIAPTNQFEAILTIPQNKIEFIKQNQTVALTLTSEPGKVFQGTIEYIAQDDHQHQALLENREKDSSPSRNEKSRLTSSLNVSYKASVPLEKNPDSTLNGGSGTAYIHTGYQTIGQRLYRTLLQTFYFDL